MVSTVAQSSSQPEQSWYSPSSIKSAVGTVASTAFQSLRHPIATVQSLGKAHYVAGWGNSGWLGETDLNPLNSASAPAIDDRIQRQIKTIDRYAPTRVEEVTHEDVEDTEETGPPTLEQSEWTRERTDLVCAEFSEKSYVYATALWVYRMTHGGKNPENDKILIDIVKKATTAHPQTGKKPELWDVIRQELKIGTFSSYFSKAKYFYFIGSPLIKKFVEESTFNTISEIRTELTKNDGKNFAEIFEKAMKKQSSFFEDYLRTIENYALKDPKAHGTRDEYIKEKLQGPDFIRDAQGNGYTEDQLYNEFSEVALDKVVPRLTWAEQIWEARNLSNIEPKTPIGHFFKFVGVIFMHLICGFVGALVWCVQAPINKWLIPYTVRAYLPAQLSDLVQNKTQMIQGNAYEHAMNKIMIDQLQELMLQEDLGDEEVPLINGSTRKELQTFVKIVLQTLNVEPKKTREDLLAFFEDKSKEPIIFAQPFKYAGKYKSGLIQSAMESALEDAMVKLYSYFVNPDRMEMVLCKAMEIANAPFSDEPIPTEADRETARNDLKRLARRFVEKTVRKAVKDVVAGKTSAEKEQISGQFLASFKKNMANHLSFINKELEALNEDPEGSAHTIETMHHFKQMIETIGNEIQEMDSDGTIPGYIKKEVKAKLDPIVARQEPVLEELNQIRLIQEDIERRRAFEQNLAQIGTHVSHIEDWKEDRWVAASNEPGMIEEILTKLPERFDASRLEGSCRLMSQAFDEIDRHKRSIGCLTDILQPGRKNPIEKLIMIRRRQLGPKGSSYTTEAVEREIHQRTEALTAEDRDKLQTAIDRVKAAQDGAKLTEEVENLLQRIEEIQTNIEREIHRAQRVISKICEQMKESIQEVNTEIVAEIREDVREIHLKKVGVEKGIRAIQKQTAQLKQERIYNTNRALGAAVGLGLAPWVTAAASYIPVIGPLASALSQPITALGGYSASAPLGAAVGALAPREGLEAAGFQMVYPDVMKYSDSLYDLLFNPNVYRGLANSGLMLVVDEANKAK